MCGNYSREETIQGRKLYEEIRYTVSSSLLNWTLQMADIYRMSRFSPTISEWKYRFWFTLYHSGFRLGSCIGLRKYVCEQRICFFSALEWKIVPNLWILFLDQWGLSRVDFGHLTSCKFWLILDIFLGKWQ